MQNASFTRAWYLVTWPAEWLVASNAPTCHAINVLVMPWNNRKTFQIEDSSFSWMPFSFSRKIEYCLTREHWMFWNWFFKPNVSSSKIEWQCFQWRYIWGSQKQDLWSMTLVLVVLNLGGYRWCNRVITILDSGLWRSISSHKLVFIRANLF